MGMTCSLHRVSVDEIAPLRKRMMKLEIYPEIWDRPVSDDENTLEWLIAYFTDLQSFVQRVADDGDAIVVHLST